MKAFGLAQKLAEDIPSLKLYSTLSPIPGFTKWLESGALLNETGLDTSTLRKVADARQALGLPGKPWSERIKEGWQPNCCEPAHQAALMRLCAAYLMHHTTTRGGDSVASFHLSNWATLHQLNWAADLPKKGIQQSAGLMVNYLYELNKVEEQHEAFNLGQVIRSRGIQRLL